MHDARKVLKMRRNAFTLIEVLVVVAIIALLVAILLPSMSKARDQAKRALCASNQKQMLNAVHMYAMGHRGAVPGSIKAFNHGLTWLVRHMNTRPSAPPTQYVHHGLLWTSKMVKEPQIFYCPSYREYPHTYPDGWNRYVAPNGAEASATSYMYSLNGQVDMYPKGVRTSAKIEQFGRRECLHACVFMGNSTKLQQKGVWPHFGGINAGIIDGSVQLRRVESSLAKTAASLYDPNSTSMMDYFSFCFFKMLSGDSRRINAYPNVLPG